MRTLCAMSLGCAAKGRSILSYFPWGNATLLGPRLAAVPVAAGPLLLLGWSLLTGRQARLGVSLYKGVGMHQCHGSGGLDRGHLKGTGCAGCSCGGVPGCGVPLRSPFHSWALAPRLVSCPPGFAGVLPRRAFPVCLHSSRLHP